jgi:hypothetical protein
VVDLDGWLTGGGAIGVCDREDGGGGNFKDDKGLARGSAVEDVFIIAWGKRFPEALLPEV